MKLVTIPAVRPKEVPPWNIYILTDAFKANISSRVLATACVENRLVEFR